MGKNPPPAPSFGMATPLTTQCRKFVLTNGDKPVRAIKFDGSITSANAIVGAFPPKHWETIELDAGSRALVLLFADYKKSRLTNNQMRDHSAVIFPGDVVYMEWDADCISVGGEDWFSRKYREGEE